MWCFHLSSLAVFQIVLLVLFNPRVPTLDWRWITGVLHTSCIHLLYPERWWSQHNQVLLVGVVQLRGARNHHMWSSTVDFKLLVTFLPRKFSSVMVLELGQKRCNGDKLNISCDMRTRSNGFKHSPGGPETTQLREQPTYKIDHHWLSKPLATEH